MMSFWSKSAIQVRQKKGCPVCPRAHDLELFASGKLAYAFAASLTICGWRANATAGDTRITSACAAKMTRAR